MSHQAGRRQGIGSPLLAPLDAEEQLPYLERLQRPEVLTYSLRLFSVGMGVQLACSSVTLLVLLKGVVLGLMDDGWSMYVQSEVRAISGYPVVLPCTFSHPQHSQHFSLQVMWRLGHGKGSTILYRCTSRPGAPTCEPETQQDQRYRLEGNPREHDLSLRIKSTTLQDSGRYYCRVEVQGREHASVEDKMGTRLRVEAPPKILTMLVDSKDRSGLRAACHVQGSPLPDIQWLGPNDLLEGSPVGSLAQDSTTHYRTVSQLNDVEPGQHYTCSASNPLGKDQSTLYILTPTLSVYVSGATPSIMLLLTVSLGAKVLLLVGMGVTGVRGRCLKRVCSWWK
ncbi:V-set and Ig domain-containing protein [Brachionichthys hirsutus]|uniref:V-set and Ig domain-containing protein n=1 Tax=Brachionichthys hirsutus TaxID=412623 RepID=UPI0036043B68